MAPRKNVENTAKKTPRKRATKAKDEEPKKTPAVIRVKIPVKPFGLNGVASKLNKTLYEERQLELSNEVAFAQFKQPDLSADPLQRSLLAPEPEPIPVTPAKTKRKAPVKAKATSEKVKRKKVNESNDAAVDSVSEQEVEIKIPNKKATKKPVAKKVSVPKNSKAKTLPPTNDEKTANTKPAPRLTRGRRRLIRPETNSVSVEKVDTTKVDESKIKEKIPTKKDTLPEPPNSVNIIPNGTVTRSLRKKMVPKRILSNDTLVSTSNTKITGQGKAGTISRKASCNSTVSSLSWTQDISMSTTTTTCVTVTSDDFVRIDKKLPVLQMTPVQSSVLESSSSSSPTSSSSSSSSFSSSSDSEVMDEKESQLNLSASTSVPRQTTVETRFEVDGVSALIDKMASSLREFETFLDARFGGTVRPRAVRDDMMREVEIMTLCRTLRQSMSVSDDVFARPAPPRPREKPAHERSLPAPERPPSAVEKPLDPADEFTSDRVRFMPFEHDDDDALSLFAESITGIESSRAAGPAPAPDEYVPAPVAPAPAPRRYRPTRIEPRRQTICEKHSADSTSVRDSGARQASQDPPYSETMRQFLEIQQPAGQYPETQRSQAQSDVRHPEMQHMQQQLSQHWKVQSVKRAEQSDIDIPATASRPALFDSSLSRVTPPTQGQSAFFRGICFFYLALNRCRYEPCRFLHHEPSAEAGRARLRNLQDKVLLRELALVSSYPALRRRFAALFVVELARRGLTRPAAEALALLEPRGPGGTVAFEAALMHLNTVDLNEVQDVLKPSLCDEMLTTLANTQNFSRFRAVFSKLARFVSENKRSVPLDVVSKILERVCILPCEENLARAMLQLIEQTDASIYDNELMASFEVHLDSIGGSLFEEFLAGKTRKRRPEAETPPAEREAQERYTSPDTTHYDNLNLMLVQPMITRTVDLKRARTDTTIVTYDPTVPPPPQKTSYDWRKYPHQAPMGMPRPNGVTSSIARSNMPVNSNGVTRPVIRPNLSNVGIRRTVTKRPVTVSYGPQNNYQRTLGDYYE